MTHTKDRTFLALRPSPDQRRALGAVRERLAGADDPGAPRLRFVDPDATHLTLAFLGEVPRERQHAVVAAARRAAAACAPFRWTLEGVGAFPGPVRPRVVWVGVGDGREPVAALQRAVTAELRAAGLAPPDDRPFTPHVTIARARGRPSGSMPDVVFRAPASSVAALDVMISELRPEGAHHRRMARVPLGTPPSEGS